MFEASRSRIVYAETRLAESPHNFAGVGPKGVADLLYVLFVVVTAEHRVVRPALGQSLREIGVMIQRHLLPVHLELGEMSVKRDVIVLRRDPREKKCVAVVISEDHVDRTRETLRELREGERGAEVSEKH